jgi:CRISPR/Cas system-associated protein Cas10 (large subunit of type III CRISPR-Cas system)
MTQEPFVIIKGDVTGIQNYIFTVKTDGAAQQLKLRSQEVKKRTDELSREIAQSLNGTHLMSGGGYFLLKAPKPADWETQWLALRKRYETKERAGRLNLVLSYIDVKNAEDLNSNYTTIRSNLEKQAGIDKLRQGSAIDDFFQPYDPPVPKTSSNIRPEDVPTWDDCQEQPDEGIPPRNGIIDFDHLAEFAKQRTGSNLLGALKLDVDNLGGHFKDLTSREASDKLATHLNKFFGTELRRLREEGSFKHNDSSYRYKDNIYLVFAGGDDTFLLGGFDAVLEFTEVLHKKFKDFSDLLMKEITQLKKNITFSASLIFFNPSFPVLKMADIAEQHLSDAKEASPEKNRIAVMGEVFTWEEFLCMKSISNQLDDLVRNRKESKAIISRIRESHKGYAAAVRNVDKGRLELPRVWRLFYFIRNVKKQNRNLVEKLISKYESLILNAFINKQQGNPMMFPVAARIAEYKLKNHQS